jgi:hypothetical protein
VTGVPELTEDNQGIGGIAATPDRSVGTANLIVFPRISLNGKHDIQRCVADTQYSAHDGRLRSATALSTHRVPEGWCTGENGGKIMP